MWNNIVRAGGKREGLQAWLPPGSEGGRVMLGAALEDLA